MSAKLATKIISKKFLKTMTMAVSMDWKSVGQNDYLKQQPLFAYTVLTLEQREG